MYIGVYSTSYLFNYVIYFKLLLLFFFVIFSPLAAVANKYPHLRDNKGILILITNMLMFHMYDVYNAPDLCLVPYRCCSLALNKVQLRVTGMSLVSCSVKILMAP